MPAIFGFFRSAAALIFLCLFGASVPACAGEIEELLARYVEWRGGAAFVQMRSLRQTGTLETDGLTGREERLRSVRGESVERADLGLVKINRVVGRSTGWKLTASGQVESLAEDAAQDERRETQLQFAGVLRPGDEPRLSLRPDETHDERSWRVVHVDFGGRDSYDLFLDETNGVLHGYRMVRDNDTIFVRLSDWRFVAGVRLPFMIEALASTPADNSTFRVARADVNPTLLKAWLQRPKGVIKAHFAGGARRTSWMPFEFPDKAQIFVPLRVNGVTTRAVLDSGAEITVLDRDFAKRLGIRFAGATSASGTEGKDVVAVAKNVDIRLGQLTLRKLTVAVMPMGAMAKAMGYDMSVVLGKNLFDNVVVDIDFQNQRIAFERFRGYTPPKSSYAIEAKSASSGLRTVDVSVENSAAIPMDFDLGNANTMYLNASFWKSRKLDERTPASVRLATGVGGQRIKQMITLERLKLGDMEFTRVPSDLAPEGPSAAASHRTMGNLGMGVWRHFHLITDYAHDRLYLTPYHNTRELSLDKDRSGLALRRLDTGLEVAAVAEDAPAARQGWAKGDRIETINGLDATAPQLRRWATAPEGTSFMLRGVNANGQAFSRKLTLIDFF